MHGPPTWPPSIATLEDTDFWIWCEKMSSGSAYAKQYIKNVATHNTTPFFQSNLEDTDFWIWCEKMSSGSAYAKQYIKNVATHNTTPFFQSKW